MSEPGRRAVILAGGLGTRLRPYTTVLPKPLLPIGERPILEIVLRQLARAGFSRATLAVNHQAGILRAFCAGGERFGLVVDDVLELEPLGTMGPLRGIPDLPSHFLVMNGDILTDLDFAAFLDAHAREERFFSIATARRELPVEFGVLEGADDGRLARFEEKPRLPVRVSTGVYAVSRRVLDWIPPAGPFGFDQLMVKLLGTPGAPEVRLVPHDGVWLDIGRPSDYEDAIDRFPALESRLLGGSS